MKAWPKGWLVWAGGALLVVVNAIVLGGAWYNRSGEPVARLQLSERELSLPYYWHRAGDEENSGLALQLEWQVERTADVGSDPLQEPPSYRRDADWLDADKLRALGFDLPAEVESEPLDESQHGGRVLPRSVWLLLEFDGDAYRRSLAETERWVERVRAASAPGASPVANLPALADAEKRLRREREHGSRLFVIDADLDPVALRQRHPDTAHHLIARGRVRAHWSYPGSRLEPRLEGYVEAVDIDSVHVSTRFRPVFEPLSVYPVNEGPPRYHVELAYGRRFEPWIVDASRVQ